MSIDSMLEAVSQLIAAQNLQPTVVMSAKAWRRAMKSLDYPAWPTEFSCNRHHEVFVVDSRGYHWPPLRESTPKLTRALAPCVEAYLAWRPAGGRFAVDLKGGVVTRHLDKAVLARLVWVP